MDHDYHYVPWEVCLFKEDAGAGMWVVEYLGNGTYFETFEEALAYIRSRHEEDPAFATPSDRD